MNQTFFIFAVFSTLTRPGLPGVKSPSGGGCDYPGRESPGQRHGLQNYFEKYQENA